MIRSAFHWSALLLLLPALGCAKSTKEKDNKIKELKAGAQAAEDREAHLKGEVARLGKQVSRLRNDFKIYSQKPCDYQLDGLDYSIRPKEKVAAARPVGGVSPRRATGFTGRARPKAQSGAANSAQAKEVSARFRRSLSKIRRCYTQALKRSSTLQMGGKRVKLKFIILPSGGVRSIMVSPPVGAGFEGCVRGLISPWRFASFKGAPRRMWIPLNLRPQ